MLANLRKMALSPGTGGSGGGSSSSMNNGLASDAPPGLAPIPTIMPSVPPEIAHILLPSPPNSRGIGVGARRPAGAGVNGGGAGAQGMAIPNAGGARRRGPAGPAPPPSWLAQSRQPSRPQIGSHDRSRQNLSLGKSSDCINTSSEHAGEEMPDLVRPARGSLVDIILRRIVREWDVQKHYNQHHLVYLQGSLRAALISYLGQQSKDGTSKGVSIKDLQALLLQSPSPLSPTKSNAQFNQTGGSEAESEVNESSGADGDLEGEHLSISSTLNEDFRYLDLTWSMGQSISVRELSDLLFSPPTAHSRSAYLSAGESGSKEKNVIDSWDGPGGQVSLPRPLLPTLTHLSLALVPGRSPSSVSWRQLLSFASHLPMLTHLSLAYWPEPTLTPNAKLATVDSPLGSRFHFDSTGTYSDTPDSDWAEAVLLVRKLSKALYGLEYLDLTGCVSWLPALMRNVDNGQVDWVGNWGKIKTLVIDYGVTSDSDRLTEEALEAARAESLPDLHPGWSAALHLGEVARRFNALCEARVIENHIRRQRAGQGRFITVIYDRQLDASRSK
ncbi:hypothetical protein SEPCBS57363_002453 [Sporothrix epigloea]|uniref:Tafazzin n=1 Tax=Sporothrix epigloea TaxID=1892477 RepID=A0ABP0DFZ7_9PEZI